MSNRPGPITGLPMIAVHVADPDRAVKFYGDVLGLPLIMDQEMEQLGGRFVLFSVPGSDTTISLMPAGEWTPAGANTGIRLKVDDARAWYAYLPENGAKVHDLLEWPGVPPMFVFQDLDGNALVIVS